MAQVGRSSTEILRQNAGIAQAPTEQMTVPVMLKKYQAEIARALPKHMTGDRMARIALTAFNQNPELMKCDPRTVFAAIIISSQLGLEVGQLGHAYLVPYNTKRGNQWVKECQFIPGWKGLVDLVNRAGRASVWTGAVYAGDKFTYKMGTETRIDHEPCGNEDDLTHVYAVGKVRGSESPIIEVWTAEKVKKHRDRYNKVGDRHYSFRHFDAYARKVVLLQVIKYMPVSVEIATAYELDSAAEKGGQHLDLTTVEQGFLPPPPSEPDNADAGPETLPDFDFELDKTKLDAQEQA